ncbi:MAG TPA: DUF4112 domain-containing protein [Pyrinomonadaceae bacterium]|jgi:hypothetical protein
MNEPKTESKTRRADVLPDGNVRAAAPLTTKRQPSKIEIEESLDQLSRWMDGLFRIPGTGWRIGLDAIVGLIPGIGDTATTIVSFYILAAGVRYRVPKITLLRMGLNLGLDYVFGAVPIIGDLFDAAWKSNQRNVALIRERATASPAEKQQGRLGDWLFLGIILLVLLLLLVGSIVVAWYILLFAARHLPSIF